MKRRIKIESYLINHKASSGFLSSKYHCFPAATDNEYMGVPGDTFLFPIRSENNPACCIETTDKIFLALTETISSMFLRLLIIMSVKETLALNEKKPVTRVSQTSRDTKELCGKKWWRCRSIEKTFLVDVGDRALMHGS